MFCTSSVVTLFKLLSKSKSILSRYVVLQKKFQIFNMLNLQIKKLNLNVTDKISAESIEKLVYVTAIIGLL